MPSSITPDPSAPLTPERLAEIRDRWALIPAHEQPRITVTNSSRGGTLLNALGHAREDVPALLAELDRLHAELAARPTRAEVLREAKAEVVAWLARKAREGTPVGRLADKVERGAVRIFLEADRDDATPRTERSYWVAIADALNAAHTAGMPVGIDLDGTLTDHRTWSVIWDSDAERWTVAGYDDGEDGEQEDDGTVAYRSRDGRQLRCLNCVPRETWTHLDWAALTDDQVDAWVGQDARCCTECGTDVLADGGDA